MDARCSSRTRRRSHGPTAITLGLVLAIVASALVAPGTAYAASRAASLTSGGTISIRSGDGCTVKLAPPSNGRKFARNFVCVFSGKTTPPLSPAAPRIQWLYNGDTMSLTSADGCALKPALPKSGRKYVRNFVCSGSSTPPPPPPPTGGAQPPSSVTGGAAWRQIWGDEFSGSGVDAFRWNVENSNYGSGNLEDECYRTANASVTGGTLRLVGRRQTVTGCGTNPNGGSTYYFTSGMVTTRAQGGPLKMKYRHGYAEVRARVPRGNLYWPAFWLVGAGDGSSPGWPAYGEVDVFEMYGSRPDVAESNFHKTGGNIGAGAHNVNNPPSSSLGINVNPPNPFVAGGTQNWHTYGINWTANKLEWFVDGVKVRTYTAAVNEDRTALAYEHSIILNLAMGGNGPRYPNHGYTGFDSASGYTNGNLVADLPGTMEVDYVRVWQP